MPYRFTAAARFPYQPGQLFLGLDPVTGNEVGLSVESHAITIGRARTGKGAAVLIPNARRWPHGLVCIDVKGENAELTWKQREAMRQTVIAIDPMHCADIPPRLRGSFNPLAAIDPSSDRAPGELAAIADGMVRRSNPKNARWDNGAVTILTGIMAHVILTMPPEKRTLATVRALLIEPKEIADADGELVGGLYHTGQLMIGAEQRGIGKQARQAGLIITDALEKDKGINPQLLEETREHTKWLDNDAIAAALDSSSFDLADLTKGNTSLFLVLPADDVKTYGAFLRLFVRAALGVMARAGAIRAKATPAEKASRRCLFLLDEFFQLGKVEEIQSSIGLMPGYGVHIWPFLQDLAQLHDLYEASGSKTFFANSDAHMFFGIDQDPDACKMVSDRIGPTQPSEAADPFSPLAPPHARRVDRQDDGYNAAQNENERRAVDHLNAQRRALHEHAMRKVGTPRLLPDEIAALTGKHTGELVARSMIVFGPGGATLNLTLAPYFDEPNNGQSDFVATPNLNLPDGNYNITFTKTGLQALATTAAAIDLWAQKIEQEVDRHELNGWIHRYRNRAKIAQSRADAARLRHYAARAKSENIKLLVYAGRCTYVTIEEAMADPTSYNKT